MNENNKKVRNYSLEHLYNICQVRLLNKSLIKINKKRLIEKNGKKKVKENQKAATGIASILSMFASSSSR